MLTLKNTFLSLSSLFISCFILFLANGLINVLLPLRMSLEGLDAATIGLVLSLYFFGLLLGAFYSRHLIQRAGHIRIFSAAVALAAASILVSGLDNSLYLWGAMRLIIGFCNACALTAMESWLSDSCDSRNRGKVLAIYNAVVLAGLFGGQFFLNLASAQAPNLFILAGILLCLAVIPVLSSRQTGPKIETINNLTLTALFKISPLGAMTCICAGATYSALFNLLPLFAQQLGLSGINLSWFMASAILSGFVLQFPIGYLSDRYDRRSVLLALLIISTTSAVGICYLSGPLVVISSFVLTSIISGIIACLYPLSVAETFDKLTPEKMVAAMGGLVMCFSLGGMVGPYCAGLLMEKIPLYGLFYYLFFIQSGLGLFVIYRMIMRPALPITEQEEFIMQSPILASNTDLDPRADQPNLPEDETPTALTPSTVSLISISNTHPELSHALALTLAQHQPQLALELFEQLSKVKSCDSLKLYLALADILPGHFTQLSKHLEKNNPRAYRQLFSKQKHKY